MEITEKKMSYYNRLALISSFFFFPTAHISKLVQSQIFVVFQWIRQKRDWLPASYTGRRLPGRITSIWVAIASLSNQVPGRNSHAAGLFKNWIRLVVLCILLWSGLLSMYCMWLTSSAILMSPSPCWRETSEYKDTKSQQVKSATSTCERIDVDYTFR